MNTSFTGGRGYDGSPRIYDDFVDWQEAVSRKRIIRLMQEQGLKARVRKRYKGTTMSDHDQPVADNLLQPEFTAERPINAGSATPARRSRTRSGMVREPRRGQGQLFDDIEVFYNQRPRHSSAGRMSPAAFERRMTHAA